MSSVRTATGDVEIDRLGRTLPHEHLLVNHMREHRGEGLLNDPAVMRTELLDFAAVGGGAVVDLTSSPLTEGALPDPLGLFLGPDYGDRGSTGTRSAGNVSTLRELSKDSGIHIVLGTGHYRDPYLDGWFAAQRIDEIVDGMVRDIAVGFPGTDVKAGVIGEIGADKWYISELEERSFRASARAQERTGAAISTHAARWPVGVAQLQLLQEEGADPNRVIIGHCDSVNIPEYHLWLAKHGAYVQFDGIGDSEHHTMASLEFVMRLRSAGYLEKIMLSHDICRTDQLRVAGGCGYGYIMREFLAMLLDAGLSQDEVDEITIRNPARALAM